MVLLSAMLRSASDSVPLRRAFARSRRRRASVPASPSCPARRFAPLFPSAPGRWRAPAHCSRRRWEETISIGRAIGTRCFSRFDRTTSTRSFGRMKPPAPVSAEISVDTARMPVGRMAAMKPEPLALTSFCSRIGSPAMNGARAIEPTISLDGLGPVLLANEAAARTGFGPGLPLQVFGGDGLAETDVILGHQRRPSSEFADGCDGAAASLSHTARKIGGNAAGTNAIRSRTDNSGGVHTLLLIHDAATLPAPKRD